MAGSPVVGAVILAAGLGTRMKSDKAKVLHPVLGRPMISYVVETAQQLAGESIVVVVGHQADQVKRVVNADFQVGYALQAEQLGTGHAVLCAMPHIRSDVTEVVVLCGDVPLVKSQTLERLARAHLAGRHDVTVLGVDLANPTGYGRLLFTDDGQLSGIVEEADATDRQKEIRVVNTGIYVIKKEFLADALPRLRAENAQNEIYLTDIIGIGYRQRRRMGVVVDADDFAVMGINSRDDLKKIEAHMARKDCEKS